MKIYYPFIGEDTPNESKALLMTLKDLLVRNEEITIDSDEIKISYDERFSSTTYEYLIKNEDKPLLFSTIDDMLRNMKSFYIMTENYVMSNNIQSSNIKSSFSFLNYESMLPKLKEGLDVKSYYAVKAVDNVVNSLTFNLKIEECSKIPNRIKRINEKDLDKIKNVILLTRIMDEERTEKTFNYNNQHVVSYDGIVNSNSCTQLDISSLLDMEYASTSYTDLRLCSTVFADKDSLYIPLSYLSIKSLPHLIYELGLIVQKINSINVNVNKSWYFMEDTNTIESLEILSFHKQDYLKAEALLEERLALLRRDMELLDMEIKAINNRPKRQVVKPDNCEIAFMYSVGESTLVLSTKQIHVRDDKIPGVIYNLGTLDIILSKGNDAPQFINKHQQIMGCNIPHSVGSNLCLGNIRDDVYKLMTTNKDIEFLSDYLINFLKHPNTSDPWGSKIRLFPVINTNDVEDKDLIMLNMVRLADISEMKLRKLFRRNTEILLAKKDIEEDEISFYEGLLELFLNNSSIIMDYCSNQKIEYPLYENQSNMLLLLIREEAFSHTFNDFDKFTDRQRMKSLGIKENKRDYKYIMEKKNDHNISVSSQES